jgi:AP2-like factor, euAP2 lineage
MARVVPVSNGRYHAIVDDEDYERVVAAGPWYYEGTYQVSAFRCRDGKKDKLNSFVLGQVHQISRIGFIDHNSLNCQKSNLHFTTIQKSGRRSRKTSKPKSSRFKGVWIDTRRNTIHSAINVNRTNIKLGRFDTEEDAARAYDEAAKRYFGNDAMTNDMLGLYNGKDC